MYGVTVSLVQLPIAEDLVVTIVVEPLALQDVTVLQIVEVEVVEVDFPDGIQTLTVSVQTGTPAIVQLVKLVETRLGLLVGLLTVLLGLFPVGFFPAVGLSGGFCDFGPLPGPRGGKGGGDGRGGKPQQPPRPPGPPGHIIGIKQTGSQSSPVHFQAGNEVSID